jgi:hypothetical protein
VKPAPSLATRASTVPVRTRKAGKNLCTEQEYERALHRETELSLRFKDRWPYTGPERWHAPSTAELKDGGGW